MGSWLGAQAPCKLARNVTASDAFEAAVKMAFLSIQRCAESLAAGPRSPARLRQAKLAASKRAGSRRRITAGPSQATQPKHRRQLIRHPLPPQASQFVLCTAQVGFDIAEATPLNFRTSSDWSFQ
jgi:hypothetical protein